MKWSRGWVWLVVVTAMLLFTGVASADSLMDSQFVDYTGMGLGVVEAGVGLMDLQTAGSKEIVIDIPGEVQEAYLYWAGRDGTCESQDLSCLEGPPFPDQMLVLNGTEVSGSLAGYESQWPGAYSNQRYMNLGYGANVTDIIRPKGSGPQSFVITDGDPGNNLDALCGAGLIVLYTDPNDTTTSRVIGYAGLDFAYGRYDQEPNAQTTEPVIFDHGSAPTDRMAEVIIFAGDAEAHRGDRVDISDANGNVTEYTNLLGGNDGPDWDTLRFDVSVPSGGGSTSAEVMSLPFKDADDDPDNPDSLLWTVGLIRIPMPVTEPEPASLGDYVWEDLNGNGQQDDGEPGVADVTVKLFTCAGGIVGETMTNGDGYYLFENLVPDCYRVEFVLPAGAAWTEANVGHDAIDSDSVDGLSHEVTLGSGDSDLTVDAGLVWLVEDCEPCEGKVTWLQLQYYGDEAQVKVLQKKEGAIFDQNVPNGGIIDLFGVDKKGTLGTEITILVNGQEATKIHTSCSQPIGPGMWFGDFYVLAGASRIGGLLCPDENPEPTPTPPPSNCGDCEGKVTWLQLRYYGDEAQVKVLQKKEGAIFDQNVPNGGIIDLFGVDKKGTLGTEITILVGGQEATKIHTSCSQPIGPGMWFGDFYVLAGASRIGGLLCPEETPGTSPPPEEKECGCEGKVSRLILQYQGAEAADITVYQRKVDDAIFVGNVAPGESFELLGKDKKDTLNVEITLLVGDEVYAIHTSCSQPVGPGMIVGPFMVVEGDSREGGPLCPLEP